MSETDALALAASVPPAPLTPDQIGWLGVAGVLAVILFAMLLAGWAE